MYIKGTLLITIIVIFVSCCANSKLSRNEKKVKQQIVQVAKTKIGERLSFSESNSSKYILAEEKKESVTPYFKTLLVFENKTGELLFTSEKVYQKAYWKNNILILEKKLGIIKQDKEIGIGTKENIIRHSFNPKTQKLSIEESEIL